MHVVRLDDGDIAFAAILQSRGDADPGVAATDDDDPMS